MKFGDYIRQKREKNGWTQPEAAARAEIEQSYLSKLETGKSYPSEDIFTRLIEIYAIDLDDLGRQIYAAELDKLREIRQVRTMILAHGRSQTGFLRAWLIAGLVMLMISGGMLGLAFSLPPGRDVTYLYRSEGVILPGEPMAIFNTLIDDDRPLSDRVSYDFREHADSKGDYYVEPVEGGYRRYGFYELTGRRRPSAISWHYAFGAMFLIGGLGCFYISRRWH